MENQENLYSGPGGAALYEHGIRSLEGPDCRWQIGVWFVVKSRLFRGRRALQNELCELAVELGYRATAA